MDIFVIARKDKEFLETPVLHAGADGKGEAITVFTERQLAEKYIADAQWDGEYEVGQLQPIQLLRWFTIAHQDGCDVAAVNPDHPSQVGGERQSVVSLAEPLESFGKELCARLLAAVNSTGESS